jgi:hypothetical protein
MSPENTIILTFTGIFFVLRLVGIILTKWNEDDPFDKNLYS